MIVSAIMWQLQRIQRLEHAVTPDARDLGCPLFDVIDALFGHIASEESMLENVSDARVRAEWADHRVHHARARLACFRLATCDAVDRLSLFDELRTVLRGHAQHEMLVVRALRGASDDESLGGCRDGTSEAALVCAVPVDRPSEADLVCATRVG